MTDKAWGPVRSTSIEVLIDDDFDRFGTLGDLKGSPQLIGWEMVGDEGREIRTKPGVPLKQGQGWPEVAAPRSAYAQTAFDHGCSQD